MSYSRTITWADGVAGGTPLTAARLNSAFQEIADYVDTKAATVYQVATFVYTGPLITLTGTTKFLFPFACTIVGCSAVCGTAPTGTSIIVDVNKNGSTIYSTQGNRPTIAASATAASETAPNTTALAAGDYLSVDIDQVGSTVAGSDLTVVVRYR